MILADEPTGELDSETGFEIVKLLSDLCRGRKRTVAVAPHDEKIVKLADVTYRVRDGTITSK